MTTLLAVDVGNTNTVLGVFAAGSLAAHWRIQTVAERTADEYAVLVKTLLDINALPWRSINAGIISSVVPPTLFGLQQFFKRHCRGAPPGGGARVQKRVPMPFQDTRPG